MLLISDPWILQATKENWKTPEVWIRFILGCCSMITDNSMSFPSLHLTFQTLNHNHQLLTRYPWVPPRSRGPPHWRALQSPWVPPETEVDSNKALSWEYHVFICHRLPNGIDVHHNHNMAWHVPFSFIPHLAKLVQHQASNSAVWDGWSNC